MSCRSFIRKAFNFPFHYFYFGRKFLDSKSSLLKSDYSEKCSMSHVALKHAIVCMFNGKIAHGGLADRLYGIVSMYEYAIRNGFAFKIYHVFPFPLDLFLVPNQVNWKVDDTELCYNSVVSIPIYVAFSDNFFEKSFVVHYLRKKISGYEQYHVYPSIKTVKKSDFSSLYCSLFKPSPFLEEKLENVSRLIGGDYISLSFRFVELLGDFEDSLHTTYSLENREILINRCIKSIECIRRRAVAHSKVVVTSDSVTFLNRVKELSDVFIIPGKVGHVDYQKDTDVHLKTFLDFYVIANAKEVYMVRTKDMYRSGFAKCAAMIYDRPFREFLIK